MRHSDAVTRTLNVMFADEVLDPERDAIAVETLRGLAERLDIAEEDGDSREYRMTSAELRAWWGALLDGRGESAGGTVHDLAQRIAATREHAAAG